MRDDVRIVEAERAECGCTKRIEDRALGRYQVWTPCREHAAEQNIPWGNPFASAYDLYERMDVTHPEHSYLVTRLYERTETLWETDGFGPDDMISALLMALREEVTT